jgi:hypothetical protein
LNGGVLPGHQQQMPQETGTQKPMGFEQIYMKNIQRMNV